MPYCRSMRIRWKFFFALLVFSLTPLLVVAFFDQYGTARLGEDMARAIRTDMANIVFRDLEQAARNSSLVLRRSKSALDFALIVLARETERALSGRRPELNSENALSMQWGLDEKAGESAPAPDNTIKYTADDFDDPAKAPPDLGPDPGYFKRLGKGPPKELRISREHPVRFTAPGLKKADVAWTLRRLGALIPVFKTLFGEFGDMVHWSCVSLENGLHLAYPGHGGYPDGYDPRKRPWYAETKRKFLEKGRGNAGNMWSDPLVDAASGRVVFTLSRALTGPDGGFAGVVGLDILLTQVLQENVLQSQWSDDMRAFMTVALPNPETGGDGLMVLARKSYESKVSAWDDPIAYEWLTSSDKKAFRRFLDMIKTNASGHMEMPYKGEDSFWAYASFLDLGQFVIIAPKSSAMALADQADAEVREAMNFLLAVGAGVALLAVLAVTLAAFFSAERFTRPMRTLIDAWERLGKGDFSVRVNLKANDERDVLVDSFNAAVPKLADQLRLSQSMELAREVQQALLPQDQPRVPGLDVAGTSIYCDETGGDYYDYYHLDREDGPVLAVVVGDITGHGLGAAMLMATARGLLRSVSNLPGGLGERVTRANRLLYEDTADTGRFMTLFWMEINLETGLVRWVRAGHDPAALLDPATGEIEELMGRGVPLGVIEDYVYEARERVIDAPGSVLLIGTDGIWEAGNATGEMFGKERMYDILRQNAHGSAAAVVRAVRDAVMAFRQNARREDDITLVVVKRPAGR